MKLSEKIKRHRKEIGLTQVDLGLNMGVTQNAISRWENEERTPCFETREKLSRIFNIPISFLKDMNNQDLINQIALEFELDINDKTWSAISLCIDERETNNELKAQEIVELLGLENTKKGRVKRILTLYLDGE